MTKILKTALRGTTDAILRKQPTNSEHALRPRVNSLLGSIQIRHDESREEDKLIRSNILNDYPCW